MWLFFFIYIYKLTRNPYLTKNLFFLWGGGGGGGGGGGREGGG